MTVYSFISVFGEEKYGARVTLIDPADRYTHKLLKVGDVVIISGAKGFDQRYNHVRKALALQRRLGIGVVVSDATWAPRSQSRTSRAYFGRPLLTAVEKTLIKGFDHKRTRYCFLTTEEAHQFSLQAKVPSSSVRVTPFFATMQGTLDFAALQALPPAAPAYVFAGGDSSRDFQTLRGALDGIGATVRIATKRPATQHPSNFVEEHLPKDAYNRAMAQASVCIVPLIDDKHRSAGQQSYYNSMALGVPTVVSDVLGVRAATDGGAFIVPPGNAPRLREMVLLLLNASPNDHSIAKVVGTGKMITESRFSRDNYFYTLTRIAMELRSKL